MGSLGRFSALNAKIKAMTPGLVSDRNYNDLQKLGTEREIAKYLHDHTRFKSVFKIYNIESLKRWEIELIILRELIVDFNKLRNFLDGNYSKFIDALLFRYEVRDLKLVLRAIIRKEANLELKEHFMHDPSREHIDFDKLINLSDMSEITSFMKGTVFEEAFINLEADDISKIEFHLDMMLDSLYFKKLFKSTDKMDKEDKKIVTDSIALQIDLLNIQWIYRAKNYHELLDEELLNYTLLGGHLSFKKLKRIIYASDYNNELKLAASKIGAELSEKDDEYLQIRMYGFFLKKLEKMAKKNPMSIAPLVYFIHRLEYESKDIISIIEGIRYSIDDIQKLLVKGGN